MNSMSKTINYYYYYYMWKMLGWIHPTTSRGSDGGYSGMHTMLCTHLSSAIH